MEEQDIRDNKPDEAQELFEKFLDSRFVREKREILQKIHFRGYLTDKMVNDFAVVLDIVVGDGDLETRYYDMMKCLDSMARFETTGLR